jgi:4-amino-4-deoxy-L-arabinose transferase-like glycosyltransferase
MPLRRIINWIRDNFYLILVLIPSFILRFVNLGYSDYQGDEIKALYYPLSGQTFFQFVMDQRKGPVQFIITFLLKLLDNSYTNQFLLRLPFAVAGFLSAYFFYKFVELHFGKKIAFYSSIFFATNGFFIAFSRIVQYQSFVIMFMVLCLYALSLATKSKKYAVKGIYISLVAWALSLLSHYDGIFILPFVAYLLFEWVRSKDLTKRQKIKHFIFSGAFALFLVLTFYIPFALSLSSETKIYWQGRITGDVSTKISSSSYLFSVYQPIYVIHIYRILFVLGTTFLILGLSSKHILKLKRIPGFIKQFFVHSTDHMRVIQENHLLILTLILWLLTPFLFFEVYVHVPGTHIYCYLVPVFIFLAYGLVTLESLVFKIFEYNLMRLFNIAGILLVSSFIFFQSYIIYVDNFKEYPWEKKKFLFWTFPQVNLLYHSSLFGFPYYRDWEGIRDFTAAFPEVTAYMSNERQTISRYYIPLERDKDKAGFFVYVRSPQSFENNIISEKAAYWISHYPPVHTLTKNGNDLVRIYIMETGTLDEIKAEGF